MKKYTKKKKKANQNNLPWSKRTIKLIYLIKRKGTNGNWEKNLKKKRLKKRYNKVIEEGKC